MIFLLYVISHSCCLKKFSCCFFLFPRVRHVRCRRFVVPVVFLSKTKRFSRNTRIVVRERIKKEKSRVFDSIWFFSFPVITQPRVKTETMHGRAYFPRTDVSYTTHERYCVISLVLLFRVLFFFFMFMLYFLSPSRCCSDLTVKSASRTRT